MNVTVSLTYCDSVRSRLHWKFPLKNFRSDCHRALCTFPESVSARPFPSEVHMSVSPTPSSLSSVFEVIGRVYGFNSDKVTTTAASYKDNRLPLSHQR